MAKALSRRPWTANILLISFLFVEIRIIYIVGLITQQVETKSIKNSKKSYMNFIESKQIGLR